MHASHKHLCAIDHREFAQPKLTRRETKAYASSKRLSERVGGLGADTNLGELETWVSSTLLMWRSLIHTSFKENLGPGDLFILPAELLKQVKSGNRSSLAVGLISKEAPSRDPYEVS